MNKLAQLVFAASAVVAISASAQENNDVSTNNYVTSSRGDIVRSPFGDCWHTSYWTPADSEGCDGRIAPAPAPAPAPVPVPAPAPVSQKVTYAADALFDFDKSALKPAGKAKLDELASNLNGVNLEVIIAVGHTDSIGSAAYNQKLSIRRAEAVKAYLVHKGVEASRVYTEGKGKTQPVASNKTAAGRAQNRRVEVEVVGTKTTSTTTVPVN